MVAFWILAPIMTIAALGILFVRKAVHAALLLAVVMISLAMLYAALDAPFLFAVQIIVYTGAILMLFLFVLMLVGVDASDSVVETIRGQRLMAMLGGLLLGLVLVAGLGQISLGTAVGLDKANEGGNIQALANLMFSRYVFAFETTSALLITAAVGAMVLAHRERLTPKATQPTHGRAAGQGLRRVRQAPRSAASSGRLRPPQRGRHPGTAAGRHRRPVVGLPGAHRPGHGQVRPRDGRVDRDREQIGERSHARTALRRLDDEEARRRVTQNVTPYIVLSGILFSIGCVGVLTRRNAIVVFMCIELMLNASNLALVAFARQHGNLDGQIAAFFVMVVAAAEVVVGLAIIMTIFRTRRSASVDDASLLKY